MDDFLNRLDRFATTPSGSLTIVLATALIRLLVPRILAWRRSRAARPKKGHAHG